MKYCLSNEQLADVVRAIRRDCLVMITAAASGHPAGPLGAADYNAVLWFNYLDLDPDNPEWDLRDRYVLSNGHCSALIYSLLARRGFYDPAGMITFRQPDSIFQGHPNRLKVPGLEASTGSLGQGLSIAHGMALGAKLYVQQGREDFNKVRVFCNVGDGELNEGTIWEAIASAGYRGTDNLTAMIDWNNCQIDGFADKVKDMAPIPDKFRAFNWHVIECDGHDYDAIRAAYDEALATTGKPTCIVFKTVFMKGAGEEFENLPKWHGNALPHDGLLRALKNMGYEFETVEEAYASIGEEVAL